jgi:hypothetical protein
MSERLTIKIKEDDLISFKRRRHNKNLTTKKETNMQSELRQEYVKIIKRYLDYTYSNFVGNNTYLPCRKQTLKARVKENLYLQQKVHISIPYNQVA